MRARHHLRRVRVDYNLALLTGSVTAELNPTEQQALARLLASWKRETGTKTSEMINRTMAKLPAESR